MKKKKTVDYWQNKMMSKTAIKKRDTKPREEAYNLKRLVWEKGKIVQKISPTKYTHSSFLKWGHSKGYDLTGAIHSRVFVDRRNGNCYALHSML